MNPPPKQETESAFPVTRSIESPEVWLLQVGGALAAHALLLLGVRVMWADLVVEPSGGGSIDFVEVGTIDSEAAPPVSKKAEGVAPAPSPIVAQQPQTTLAPPVQDDTTSIVPPKPTPTPTPEPVPTPSPSPSPSLASTQPPQPSPFPALTPKPTLAPTPKPSAKPLPVSPPKPSPSPVPPNPSSSNSPASSNVELPTPELPVPPNDDGNDIVDGKVLSSFQLQDFNKLPCKDTCGVKDYRLSQQPTRPVTLQISSPMDSLPPGKIEVDVEFIVDQQQNETAMLSNNEPIASLKVDGFKLTSVQRQNLAKAIQMLLEQCKFNLVFDSSFNPIDSASQHILRARITIQVI